MRHRKYRPGALGGVPRIHRLYRCLVRKYWSHAFLHITVGSWGAYLRRCFSYLPPSSCLSLSSITAIKALLPDLSPWPLKLVDLLVIEGGDLDLHFHQRIFDSPILSRVDFVTLGCLGALDGRGHFGATFHCAEALGFHWEPPIKLWREPQPCL